MPMWYILSSVYELMPQFWNYVLLSLLVISGVVHVRRITISHQKVCPKNWKRKSKSFLVAIVLPSLYAVLATSLGLTAVFIGCNVF